MPKKCLICRARPSPASMRSFHMFPKNECMKQKWIDAIHISKKPNFKTAFICSDHFDIDSFFYFDELRQRMRLCKEAVPKHISLIKSIDSEENVEVNDITQPSIEQVTETFTEEVPLIEALDPLANDPETLSCSTPSSESNSEKRKQSFGYIGTTKKVRFMIGFKTEYLCRQDFVTEEAWNRFLRYSAYEKSKTAAAHSKNFRQQRKINKLTRLIHILEKRDEFDADEYLEVEYANI